MPSRGPIEHTGRLIDQSIRTSATSERVWSAFGDNRILAQWFPDKAEGDLKPGGLLRWKFEKFGFEAVYDVLEVEPESRLVLGFGTSGGPRQIHEITVIPDGDETILRLVHSGLPEGDTWVDHYEGVVSGWMIALRSLKHYLEHHYGKDRSRMLVLRSVGFEYDQLAPYYASAEGLSEWIATSGSIGADGDRYRLDLKEGGTMSGEVLVRTKREVALTWDEIAGVLTLKAFGFGPGKRMLGIDAWGYGLEKERADVLEADLGKAADRLVALIAGGEN